MSSDKKIELLLKVITEGRYVSAYSVMYSQAVAAQAGQHSTDMECMDLLQLNGSMTAGKLSEMTGLTTGTVTALIDRLEKADFVRRVPDKHDRRKVLVVLNQKKVDEELVPITQPLGIALYELMQRYSEAELAAIADFLGSSNAIILEQIALLRSKDYNMKKE